VTAVTASATHADHRRSATTRVTAATDETRFDIRRFESPAVVDTAMRASSMPRGAACSGAPDELRAATRIVDASADPATQFY